MKKECTQRKIATLGHDKSALQKKLDARLSGVKRPLALLTNDDELSQQLTDYAVCQLEPLHDLKTIICE